MKYLPNNKTDVFPNTQVTAGSRDVLPGTVFYTSKKASFIEDCLQGYFCNLIKNYRSHLWAVGSLPPFTNILTKAQK